MFEFLLVANISVQGGIEAAPVGVARLTAEMTAVFWRTAPRWPLVRLGCVFAPVLSASQTDGRGWHCWQIGALQKRRTCGSEPRKKAGRSLTMGDFFASRRLELWCSLGAYVHVHIKCAWDSFVG